MLLKREEDFLFDEKANKADFCWTCLKFKKKRKSRKKKKKTSSSSSSFIHSLALLREKQRR
jgi:hypothetical protein